MKPDRYPKGSFAGPSLLELLWAELDAVTAEIMEGRGTDVLKGKAIAFSKAVAIFTNPYEPNIGGIKEEAKQRWRDNR